MRKYGLVAALSAASMVVFAACGGDDTSGTKDDGDGSGGSTGAETGGAGPGSGGMSTTGPASGGAGGGGDMCEQYFADPELDPACVSCLADQCCDEAEACLAEPGCAACFDGDDATMCDGMSANIQPLIDCFDTPACTQDDNGLICGQPICDSGLILVLTQAECAACLSTSCCNEYTACQADMGCSECILGTAADPMACEMNALLTAASDCEDTSCNMVCATEICDSGLLTGDPACNNCLEASCCTEITACANDMDCMACLTGDKMPSDPACMGNALLMAANGCWDTNCTMDCGPTQ